MGLAEVAGVEFGMRVVEFQGTTLGPGVTWADLKSRVKGAARPWTFRFASIVPEDPGEPEIDDEGL